MYFKGYYAPAQVFLRDTMSSLRETPHLGWKSWHPQLHANMFPRGRQWEKLMGKHIYVNFKIVATDNEVPSHAAPPRTPDFNAEAYDCRKRGG